MADQAFVNPAALLAQADQLERDGKARIDAAKKLRKMAGELEEILGSNVQVQLATNGAVHGKTRLEQLRNWVRAHQPVKRKDIVAGAGMPAGSVAYLLSENKGFVKDANKRWSVAEK